MGLTNRCQVCMILPCHDLMLREAVMFSFKTMLNMLNKGLLFATGKIHEIKIIPHEGRHRYLPTTLNQQNIDNDNRCLGFTLKDGQVS